jgi:hypothetical protein
MTSAEDIERAVEQLSPQELARFRTWFEAFEAERFDAAIERDARDGKLDAFAEEAITAYRRLSVSLRNTALKRMLRLPASAVASPSAPCPS